MWPPFVLIFFAYLPGEIIFGAWCVLYASLYMFGCLGILACSLCFMALKGIENCVVCVVVKCLILDGSWMKNIQMVIMLDMGLPGSAYILYKGFLDSMCSEVAITCWFHLTCLSSIRNCWLSKHVAFSLCVTIWCCENDFGC